MTTTYLIITCCICLFVVAPGVYIERYWRLTRHQELYVAYLFLFFFICSIWLGYVVGSILL